MIHTPPEVLAGNECSPASDIYSFGPLVLQLVQGCISGKYANLIPEDMLIPYMFFSKVLKEQWRPEIMNGVPSCCQELVLACWPQEPKERISIETVLEKLDSIGEEFIREGQNWPKFE